MTPYTAKSRRRSWSIGLASPITNGTLDVTVCCEKRNAYRQLRIETLCRSMGAWRHRTAKEYAEELRRVETFDEVHALWQRTNIPYKIRESDPNSRQYKEEVLAVYQALTRSTYSTQNEMTSPLQKSQEVFERGFPWSTANLGVISVELAKVTQALLALQDAGMNGKRIVEFGVGWGNLAVPLARSGQDVTVVDIDPGFLDRISRISERENVDISLVEGDFIGVCDKLRGRFDAVIFQAAFHHCLDFQLLLRRLKERVLSANGRIFFFSEPIFDNYQFPWGIRYDGESLWAVMFHRWLELGFDQSFFSSALLRAGLFLKRIPEVQGYVGSGWQASQTENGIAFGDWVLPNEYAASFHLPEASAGSGRFCRGRSRLPALRGGATSYRLSFKNHSPKPLSFTVDDEGITLRFTIEANGELEVVTPPGGGDLTILSDTFSPHECIEGNDDTRELGVFLSHVAART
jgi:2-polyprenyl-3-methyl-5-hydroxy-6-metoxy-1,4-benzoquinol methylase